MGNVRRAAGPALVAALLCGCGGTPSAPAPVGPVPGVAVANEGWAHVPEGSAVSYQSNPPASGPHYPVWLRYREYTAPMARGYWVHNLEHGAVVFLYNCPSGCPNEVARLRSLVAACGVFAVLTPYDRLPGRFAAVSWGHRLVSDCLDIEAMRAFYDANVDNGSESNSANPPGYCTP